MPADIRPVREEELPGYLEALSTSFLERPDIERLARELPAIWDLGRTLGAFEDGAVCATFRSWPTELTVPGGGRLPASAVSAVSVLPTHRRRGILRRMIAIDHAAARDRGDAVALLYASEYAIYGRLGYGPACREATWTVDVTRTGFHGEPDGRVELAPATEATRDTMIDVFERWRLGQPGEIRRRAVTWDFDLGLREEFWGTQWKGWVALHRNPDGVVDGYVRYHVEPKWEQRQPRNTLVVDDLHALDEPARGALWRFLAGIDWVTLVRAGRRSPSDALPWWLTNARAAVVDELGDSLWLRLLDVPAALAARRYDGEGRIVLEVIDAEASAGRVRLELDAGPDGATCRPTDRSADLTVDVAALGAAFLGGSPLRHAVLARGADEHRTGALDAADRLLRTRDEPWCSTFF